MYRGKSLKKKSLCASIHEEVIHKSSPSIHASSYNRIDANCLCLCHIYHGLWWGLVLMKCVTPKGGSLVTPVLNHLLNITSYLWRGGQLNFEGLYSVPRIKSLSHPPSNSLQWLIGTIIIIKRLTMQCNVWWFTRYEKHWLWCLERYTCRFCFPSSVTAVKLWGSSLTISPRSHYRFGSCLHL